MSQDKPQPKFWLMDLDDTLTDLSGGVDVKLTHDYPNSYLSCCEVMSSLPLYTAPPQNTDFPDIKYSIATSLVALNQRILDNKKLSDGDLAEMQELINAYNY